MTGGEVSVAGCDDGVTGGEVSVADRDDGVTGGEVSVAARDDGVTGGEVSVAARDDGVTGGKVSVAACASENLPQTPWQVHIWSVSFQYTPHIHDDVSLSSPLKGIERTILQLLPISEVLYSTVCCIFLALAPLTR